MAKNFYIASLEPNSGELVVTPGNNGNKGVEP